MASYGPRPRPTSRRFWEKVDLGQECWEWQGTRSRGYGVLRVSIPTRGQVLAHRYSWELHNGPIPEGLAVLHHCDNPPCVNPDHLFLGTQADNVADKVSKGRQDRGETHGRGRFSRSDIETMRRMRRDGALLREIAASFGASESHVSNVVNRKAWA